MTHTPKENTNPLRWPSFKLIFAAEILSIPGGITPIKANERPKRKTIDISKI
jgi:hypothetical protein